MQENDTNPRPTKIGYIASAGGHLTELDQIRTSLESFPSFLVTYDSAKIRGLDEPTYYFPDTGASPTKLVTRLPNMKKILQHEDPDLLITTGAELAIPFILIAKLREIRTIFIESLCRIDEPSVTGAICYHFADEFYVQWRNLLDVYGHKATYRGQVV